MTVLDEVIEITDLLYKHGWDERNGGNLSYILSKEEVSEICYPNTIIKKFTYDFDMSPLIGKYFIITGTGKYFKNSIKEPENNYGILKVLDKNTLGLVWGYKDGGRPTSEAPTHLISHIERLKVDKNHRVVMHCHPTNLIAMTHVVELTTEKFTEILWKMQTESIVVFPEGVSVLPWMLCGGDEIGKKTAEMMREYRSVVWAQHGLFGTGRTLDEAFGLIETIEKAAEIYMKIATIGDKNPISNTDLKILANAFKVNYKKGIID